MSRVVSIWAIEIWLHYLIPLLQKEFSEMHFRSRVTKMCAYRKVGCNSDEFCVSYY
jgi:hypothetical protein